MSSHGALAEALSLRHYAPPATTSTSPPNKEHQHTRPRHQIKRSITELSAPIRKHRHSHSLNRRNDDKASIPQSAAPMMQLGQQPGMLQARPSFDGARSEGVTPYNLSPNPSRRPSIMGGVGEDGAPGSRMPISSAATPERKSMRHEDPAVERAKALATTRALKTAVEDLASLSSDASHRLDETYSSISDKLDTLQRTVADLQELTGMWREGCTTFAQEARDLVDDVNNQIEGLGTYEPQRARIETLQSRIHDGRERIQGLSHRVEAVRERIDGWERADREWQERTRRRLRTGWIVMSVLALAFLLLWVFVEIVVPEDALNAVEATPTTEPPPWVQAALENGVVPEPHEIGTVAGDGITAGDRLIRALDHALEDSRNSSDEGLRVFDEL
ncbi:hypothetical protein PpBr36_08970 [Pyricularia pennisetigena]|uniref:hypothetical protein n=1 Tax=Pyricularia pennisetigena TaxID=1578925 RepID=UPI00114DCDED|nr:hypothetical protein PpBr36_08970 [Pyricularia pennisetigena]TLS23800.1 hypothetical protein PpBr36_08970 [Pyricularia pennisetigena]